MSDELKPCPFCGGSVSLEMAGNNYSMAYGRREWWGVVCRNTKNVGGTCCIEQVPSASKEAAIGRWNMRAGDRQEQLESKLKEAAEFIQCPTIDYDIVSEIEEMLGV